MSDTPRTDKFFNAVDWDVDAPDELLDSLGVLARQLERELAEAKMKLKHLDTIIEALPIDKFVVEDADDSVFIDWEKIDAADYKDHCDDFNRAMIQAYIARRGPVDEDE